MDILDDQFFDIVEETYNIHLSNRINDYGVPVSYQCADEDLNWVLGFNLYQENLESKLKEWADAKKKKLEQIGDTAGSRIVGQIENKLPWVLRDYLFNQPSDGIVLSRSSKPLLCGRFICGVANILTVLGPWFTEVSWDFFWIVLFDTNE